jgi:hypothetical protein
MDFELAEASAERDVLCLAQPLIPEAHDDIVVKQPLNLGEGRLVNRLRQVENDFRAERGIAFPKRDRHRRRGSNGDGRTLAIDPG